MIWTLQRLELRDWFRQNAPSLAPAYEGAVELFGQDTFPGRIHFIAHAVRDIANRLVFALDPELDGSRVQYENQMDKIAPNWQSISSGMFESTDGPSPNEVTIPFSVAQHINQLVLSHRARREAPDSYELLFQWLSRQDPSHATANPGIVSKFKKTRSWFVSKVHLGNNPVKFVESDLKLHFEAFEATLHSFVGSFFTGTQELDNILQQANQ